MAKKSSAGQPSTRDYLRLPFEVHYSGPVSVTTFEFKSDVPVKRFKDVKVVHMEQGRAWGVTFECNANRGPELYCCLTAGHDEVWPDWFSLLEEDEIRFNYGCDYSVEVNGEEICFVDGDDDSEIEGVDDCFDGPFYAYHLDSAEPDYLILDAEDSRVKIDVDGFEIDDEGNRLKKTPLLDIVALDEATLSEYSTRDLWEAKSDWVQSILDSQFPRDKKLRLAFDTN